MMHVVVIVVIIIVIARKRTSKPSFSTRAPCISTEEKTLYINKKD